jgi:hypothetical protein
MTLPVKLRRPAHHKARAWARPGRVAVTLACAALCSVLAAGCSSSSSSSTTPAPTTTVTVTSSAPATSASASPSAAAACATSALKITQSAPNGAAGHFYVTLVFTNTSSSPCTLYGYPGVSLLTAAQKQIGLAAKRSGKPFKLVTLAPGATGSALLDIVDALNFTPGDCSPAKAAYLRIYPPNQFSSVLLANASEGCAKAKQVLTIDPVQAGSGATS